VKTWRRVCARGSDILGGGGEANDSLATQPHPQVHGVACSAPSAGRRGLPQRADRSRGHVVVAGLHMQHALLLRGSGHARQGALT
jgi:hypothetical protein